MEDKMSGLLTSFVSSRSPLSWFSSFTPVFMSWTLVMRFKNLFRSLYFRVTTNIDLSILLCATYSFVMVVVITVFLLVTKFLLNFVLML